MSKTNSGFRDYKSILTSFIQVVTFLFASFGGFLKTIAPPEQVQASYSIGILSFLVLIILLIISAVARTAKGVKFKRHWIIAGATAFALALPPSYFYHVALNSYTWSYPPENPVKRLRGLDSDYTEEVKSFLMNNNINVYPLTELVRNFEIDAIWTPQSLKKASAKLFVLYAWLVLSLATSIFCLLEANTVTTERKDSDHIGDQK